MRSNSYALTLAIQNNMPNAVLSLIYAGEPINPADAIAPLHLALKKGHSLIAQILLVHGANTRITRTAAKEAEEKETTKLLDRLEKSKKEHYHVASATLIWAMKKFDSFTEHQTELFKRALDYLVGGGEYILIGLKHFAHKHNRPHLVETIDSKISSVRTFFQEPQNREAFYLSPEQNSLYNNVSRGAVVEITNYNDVAAVMEYALKHGNNFIALERLSNISHNSLLNQLQNNRQQDLVTFLTITTGKEINPILAEEIKATPSLISAQEDKKQEPSPEGQLARLNSLTDQIEQDIEKKYSAEESQYFEKRYPRLSIIIFTLLLVSEGVSAGLFGSYGAQVAMMDELYSCDMYNNQCPQEKYSPALDGQTTSEIAFIILGVSLLMVAMRCFERPFKLYRSNYDYRSSLSTLSENTQHTAREALDWEEKNSNPNPFERISLAGRLGVFRQTIETTKKNRATEYNQDEKAQHRISIVDEEEPGSRRSRCSLLYSWLGGKKKAGSNQQPLLSTTQSTPSAPPPSVEGQSPSDEGMQYRSV